MHLEEKTFLKKLGSIVQGVSVEGASTGANSQRQGGSSRKRQDQFSINNRSGY